MALWLHMFHEEFGKFLWIFQNSISSKYFTIQLLEENKILFTNITYILVLINFRYYLPNILLL